MRRVWVIILFLLIANFAFVFAEPNASVDKGDVEQLQGIIDKLPFDEGGRANFTEYKPYITNATKRINAINTYLDENAGWMRYLFQMRPQVSLLFAINLYFILFFFLIFFLNARGMWFFIESPNKARLFGVAVFVAFAAIGLYVGLAYTVNNFIIYIWNVLADTAVWMAGLAMFIFAIVAIIFYPAAFAIVRAIKGYLNAKREFKEKAEILGSGKAMNAFIKEATKTD